MKLFFLPLQQVMRISAIIVLILVTLTDILVAEPVEAQYLQKQVDVSFKNDNAWSALRRLEEQNIKIAYDTRLFDLSKKKIADKTFGQKTVAEVLNYLFSHTEVTYQESDGFITLLLKKQPLRIKGKVLDETGQPLPGVSVKLKGASAGTMTSQTGEYSIVIPDENAVLVYSYIGYETAEIPVRAKRVIDVSLRPVNSSLDQVVVIGYGTQKKSDLTGSVGSIKASQLLERPAINVEQGIAGRIAGVNVSTNSGRPGGRTRVRIRGFSSINAATDPLYVVDGVILTSGISSINPNDIETIDVLKDASATAIYGTRGTNGVIIITTKRGSKDGKITYDSYFSMSSLARKQDVLNAEEFLYIEDQAYINAQKFDPAGFASGKYKDPAVKRMQYLEGNTAGRAELFYLDAQGVAKPLYDVDWQDEVTHDALSQGHNLAWSGGDDKSNYGLYMGYAKDNGIIRSTFLKRYSARAVVDRQMKDWLKVGGTISYSSTEERRADDSQGGNNVTRQIIEMVPFIPYKYPNGTYGRRIDYEGLEKGDNPLAQLDENISTYNVNAFTGNAYANVKLIPGLEFNSTIGANVRNQYAPYFNSTLSDLSVGLGRNYARISSDQSKFWQWTNRLNYTKTIKEHHTLNALVGAEYQNYNYLGWSAAAQDMSDDFYKWNNLGAGATLQPSSSSSTAWQMASYFSRLNYSYKGKYLFTATGRYDGSSRFGKDNKYAFFPSAALAWRVSEENFIAKDSQISNLKLRLSYGLTGNSEIGEYRSQANLGTNSYIFNGTLASGTIISSLANPELKWEKTSQLDLGVDLGLFKNRVTLEADYYVKKTKDLLLAAPVPASSGYTTLTRNIGSLKNTGFEFNINTLNIEGQNFSWRTGFNFAWLKNEITALGTNNADILMTPDFLGRTNILRVGESVSSFYGLVAEGTWGTAEEAQAAKYNKRPGDIKYKDINGDGQINDADRQILGKGIPDFYGTLTNTLRYSNFDFTVELQYSQGNDVFRLSEHSSLDRTGLANSFADVLNGWTPENQNTPIAQWRPTGAGYDTKLDSRKVSDGSFIRGKNIMLGYTFTPQLVKKLGVSNLRLFVSGQNLFLITKYKGYDPESTTFDDTFSQGIVFHDYPKAKTFLFGINVSL